VTLSAFFMFCSGLEPVPVSAQNLTWFDGVLPSVSRTSARCISMPEKALGAWSRRRPAKLGLCPAILCSAVVSVRSGSRVTLGDWMRCVPRFGWGVSIRYVAVTPIETLIKCRAQITGQEGAEIL